VLDDPNIIKQRDPQDALGIAANQWQQLAQTYSLTIQPLKVANVVFAGMGGSALAALLSKTWPGYTVPFEICQGYEIPAYTGADTLFIASSYSGNTEETLAALKKAEAKRAGIVVIASAGKLQAIAEEKGYPFEQIPAANQPRYGVFYSLKAYVTILEKAGLVATEAAERSLHQASEFLHSAIQNWMPSVLTSNNYAKQIAQELMGKTVIIYSGPRLFPAAYKWKIDMNENAKNLAWCNQYPEFNHNEFIGWSSHPVQKPFAVVEIRSNLEDKRVQERFAVTEQLLSGKRPKPIVVEPAGETVLEQLLFGAILGDFVSIYLAILNGVNPTPVDLVEKFKQALNA
jgi:glucose/mannose-6-phosphate isomerase